MFQRSPPLSLDVIIGHAHQPSHRSSITRDDQLLFRLQNFLRFRPALPQISDGDGLHEVFRQVGRSTVQKQGTFNESRMVIAN